MLFSFRSKPSYISLVEADGDEESKVGVQLRPMMRCTRNNYLQTGLGYGLGLCLLVAITLFSGFMFGYGRFNGSNCPAVRSVSCIRPSIRREWRTLDRSDKEEYITAVQCLATKPSKLRENGTLYDDFPWVHKATAPMGKRREMQLSDKLNTKHLA